MMVPAFTLSDLLSEYTLITPPGFDPPEEMGFFAVNSMERKLKKKHTLKNTGEITSTVKRKMLLTGKPAVVK